MVTCISHSPAETRALGEAWGRETAAGWIFGLCGELGAGKTQLVKGLARGLGITQLVHSPGFTLVNHYTGGRWPLFHLDLYRLDTLAQIEAAGLGEFLSAQGVTVIEWADKWPGLKPEGLPTGPPLPFRLRWVGFEVLGPTERRICYEDFGA